MTTEDDGDYCVEYTFESLEQAKRHLEFLEDRDASDTSGNPDKYHRRLNEARSNVRRIEAYLKHQGVLQMSERELLEKRLDSAFPNATSREVVEFEGRSFQRRFFPLQKSRSGKIVQVWGRRWDLIK
tara:strand:+ start:99 stop:479 length:381 start_codon:yes stop_codon:yes gene_type:complete